MCSADLGRLNTISPSSLFPLLYIPSRMPYFLECSLDQLAILSASPPNAFVSPLSLLQWQCEKQKRLWPCVSAAWQKWNNLYYQHCFQTKSNPKCHTRYCEVNSASAEIIVDSKPKSLKYPRNCRVLFYRAVVACTGVDSAGCWFPSTVSHWKC